MAGESLSIREYITPRSYKIPAGLLTANGPNVLAVRVVSYGGAGLGPANSSNASDWAAGSFPGGFFDDPELRHHDGRVGPFDPAAVPGTAGQQMGVGYVIGGIGYYRKTFRCGPPLHTQNARRHQLIRQYAGRLVPSAVF